MPETVYLGIGSNIEPRLNHCRVAIAHIMGNPDIKVLGRSTVYETDPFGIKDQPKFLNAAICVETRLSPQDLLEYLLKLENQMGRVRDDRWGPRIIDLDILFYGEQIIDDEGLTIPHPGIHERTFVLRPLKDIAPDFAHPKLKQTVSEMLDACKMLDQPQSLNCIL